MIGSDFIHTLTLSQVVQATHARYHHKVIGPSSHLSQAQAPSCHLPQPMDILLVHCSRIPVTYDELTLTTLGS